ncbi:MAG: G5 domain-containing protein [Bacilli bacterium]|nr:G5 domain-containing protein [Bacilli bacterium]
MKNKKKLFIIIGSVVLVLALAISSYFIFFNKDSEPKNESSNKDNVEDKVVAPATNTEELLQEMEVVEVSKVTEDEIVFSENIDLKENEKVAVWIYSEPKFLGYFEVVEQDGVKMIKGLKKVMNELKIEPGNHNIAIVTEEGDSVGYIDIYVEENKIFQDEQAAIESKYTTEEIIEKTEVQYQTETKKDANKKSGSKEVIQKGVTGEIEVTYKVTYDETGKEISREKIAEKVVKEAINEIIVIGLADYNINSSKITDEFTGFMCSESQTMDYGGQIGCDDTRELPMFKAIAIDSGALKVVSLNEKAITPITITKSGNLYVGKYNGATHYFDPRSGGGNPDGDPLTLELCKQYNLSCGVW